MTIKARTRGHFRPRPAPPPRERGLVLTRRAGETIVIPLPHGEQIVITAVGGARIKFHIAAPVDLEILRGELVAAPEAA